MVDEAKRELTEATHDFYESLYLTLNKQAWFQVQQRELPECVEYVDVFLSSHRELIDAHEEFNRKHRRMVDAHLQLHNAKQKRRCYPEEQPGVTKLTDLFVETEITSPPKLRRCTIHTDPYSTPPKAAAQRVLNFEDLYCSEKLEE